uniref:Uncharacterized protein n=1 Tax=Glossina brevipalpis TaxID=37001 RepID=A0A1A9WPH8_9MUSC
MLSPLSTSTVATFTSPPPIFVILLQAYCFNKQTIFMKFPNTLCSLAYFEFKRFAKIAAVFTHPVNLQKLEQLCHGITSKEWQTDEIHKFWLLVHCLKSSPKISTMRTKKLSYGKKEMRNRRYL